MARHVVLASHGGLAEGLLDTLHLILGESVEARAWGLRPGHSATELVDDLAPEIEAHPDDSYVLLADLYGASVFTALCQLLRYPNVRLFTGLNAALAIAALTEGGDQTSEEEARSWVACAAGDVRHVTAADLVPETSASDNDF